MAKNDYLARQKARDKSIFGAGEDIGMQRMWDAVQIALRDPEVMGKDTMGRKRIEKLYHGVKAKMSLYYKAFSNDVEADYTQEKLDEALDESFPASDPPAITEPKPAKSSTPPKPADSERRRRR